jgi:HEAT repeat protein
LIQALQDQDNNEWVRSNCVIALGQIAPQSEAVIEALRSALNDKSEKVRESADRALAKT